MSARPWTPAESLRLRKLIEDAGMTARGAAVALERPVTEVRTKMRALGLHTDKETLAVVSRRNGRRHFAAATAQWQERRRRMARGAQA